MKRGHSCTPSTLSEPHTDCGPWAESADKSALNTARAQAAWNSYPIHLGAGARNIAAPTFPPSTAPWSLYSGWRRWSFLTVLFLVTTSSFFDYYILSVVLEPIKREFQVSDTVLGLLTGFCFALVYALAALPIARWADSGNRRTVIAIALTGWSVMTTLCGLAQSFWQLTLARLGVGALEPAAVPSAQSLVVDYFPPQQRSTAIAILTMGASAAGYLFAVGFGGYIAASLGWRTALLLAGMLGLGRPAD